MPRRTLAAAVALAALACLAPAASAGWTCSYYKWDAANERWLLVGDLVDQETYENAHGRVPGGYWDCRYCVVPAVPPQPPEGTEEVEQVQQFVADTAEAVLAPVRSLVDNAPVPSINVPVWPFGGIEGCPFLPPATAVRP